MDANDTMVRPAPRLATASGPRVSATRPASGAARAPAAPAKPNAPAAPAPRWNGAPCSMTARVDQNALKPNDSKPCAVAARRSPGCWRHKVASEPSNAVYDN
ncbi:hypothetical protein D3C87_1752720 [compost metagenome]